MKSQRQKYLKIEAIMSDKSIYQHFPKPIIETRAKYNSSTGQSGEYQHLLAPFFLLLISFFPKSGGNSRPVGRPGWFLLSASE
tara:strand:+ start:146 stop:394 length:249 start_codon:yes stop_codon:yes gene_type:complete